MVDWLLRHPAQLQSYALLAGFACIAVAETRRPRRGTATSLAMRCFNHIALTALGMGLVRLVLPLAALAVAVLAERRGWGLLNQLDAAPWVTVGLGVLAMDLGGYVQHRLVHAVPVLWRFHRIHHCDLDFDCTTALRHHPVEALVAGAFDAVLVAALGISPLAVVVATLLVGLANVFNHGNLAVPAGVDRRLRRFVVTPDMHRIHHSTIHDESNSNFSMLVPWWDRLFATYREQPMHGHERMELGIAEARRESEVTLWKLLVLPFAGFRAASVVNGPQDGRKSYP
jgi:sterol desaturase/sphingolipid hydroxylase (fatty acid hydroxylase superfamily)